MLTLTYCLYITAGLTQFPYLERNTERSIEDNQFTAKLPEIWKFFVHVAFIAIAIHLEPAYRFIKYAFKPWIKR